ncbi:MAG: hypothetical protein II843_03270 [Alphaproteobacteria bacterium]|nr:hypothetical protein [Alphaproteobacteria bacterium]
MRKWMFFAIVLSLCVADSGVLAAAARSAAQDVAGRVVTRNAVQSSATNSPTVVARAAMQKALNTGTKVAAATTNTAVPQECQDAFYGCMDAFCMLDNASGGRCQCSDRITELDQVLEDILKLDDQTYLMATEGVERIQMGDAADAVISRAKAAGDSVVVKDTAAAKRQKRTLDLSMWNNNIFTVDDENLFDDVDGADLVTTFADKKGDSLYTASAKMCASQITDYCRGYSSMLQLVYAQKIKSDCTAYENSLRAQKIQSQQKLLSAEKALRDAALDEYQNQNKYATLGECTIAFTECMQTTAGCGKDYTGCVTLAAAENVRNNTAGSIAKQTKIKGAIKGADISLAVSTMNQLIYKKPMCESVTKQCINANKNDAVWESFLRNAAPALKSAELVAEQNLRSSCLPNLAECFKNGCRERFSSDEGSYDACLSNPEIYKSLCKVQLEPCLEATGGTYDRPTDSSLWNSLIALLNAMKVDACTAEIKSCLVERCGDDYSECIGLTVEAVGDLCPYQKLTACMTSATYSDADAVRDYVAEIAQGLALQVNNALASACQNAVNEAMINVCGDTESCESAVVDLSSLASVIRPRACTIDTNGEIGTCYANVSAIPSSAANNGFVAALTNRPAISAITYNTNGTFSIASGYTYSAEFSAESTNRVLSILNGALNRTMNSIESDVKVKYCLEGRSVPGFSGFNGLSNSTANVGFPNLTNSIRATVAEYLLSSLYEQNEELQERFTDNLDTINEQIANRFGADAVASGAGGEAGSGGGGEAGSNPNPAALTAAEATQDATNRNQCICNANHKDNKDKGCYSAEDPNSMKKSDGGNKADNNTNRAAWYVRELNNIEGNYDAATNICTVRKVKYKCTSYNGTVCKNWDSGTTIGDPELIQMPISGME